MKFDFDTDDGIGTRATLGVIVLETDETLEPEFNRLMAVEGVALYHSRIPMVSDIHPDSLEGMAQDLPGAVTLLPPSLEFDVIGYGCTSASSVIGSDRVARLIQQQRPGVQVTDPLAAIIAAARHLNLSRLGFLTPYIPQVSLRMQTRLEEAGLTIAAFGSFEEGDDRVVARISETSIKEAACRLVQPASPGVVSTRCDGIVVSCTNLRSLGIVREIEDATGLPVISSNLALAWHMLRLAGVDEARPEFGRLFEK